MMTTVAWPAVAQMITALAATVALFLAPTFAARNERRSRIAASRQQWLDGLRAEVAELLSLWSLEMARRRHEALHPELKRSAPDATMARVDQVHHSIRFRLNIAKPEHYALETAISEMLSAPGSMNYPPGGLLSPRLWPRSRQGYGSKLRARGRSDEAALGLRLLARHLLARHTHLSRRSPLDESRGLEQPLPAWARSNWPRKWRVLTSRIESGKVHVQQAGGLGGVQHSIGTSRCRRCRCR